MNRVLVILVFSFALLSGCMKSDKPVLHDNAKSGTVTLTLMANQDWTNKPYLQRAWKHYEESTGNNLDIQAAPIDTASTIISKRVAMGEITDIVMSFGGAALSDLHPEDNFVDLTGEPWISQIKSSMQPQITFQGKIYGLPLWEYSVSGILYNKELFNKYGIPVPSDREQFDEACERLLAHGVTPIYMAAKDIWPLNPQYGLDPLVRKYPHVIEDLNTNRTRFSDLKEVGELIEDYKRMASNGYFGDNYLNNNWDGQAAALVSGQYAMALAWDVYLYSDVEPQYPGMAEKFGIMPFFLGSPEAVSFEGPNAAMLMVNKSSPHLREAMEFIRFLAKPENLNYAFENIASETNFTSVTSNRPTSQYLEAKQLIERYENPSITPFIIGYNQLEMGRIIQRVLTGDLTVEEALGAMDAMRTSAARVQNIPGF